MSAPDKPEPAVGTALRDEDIKTESAFGRRTLLSLIAGATGAGVASCVPAGNTGRGLLTPQPTTTYTGLTDSDTGQFQDQPGYGRHGSSTPTYTGLTDSDAGQYEDQAGYGRYGSSTPAYTGLTDNDTGQYQDQPGYGRYGSSTSTYTGLTDSDSGPYQDSPGYGRRGY
ncbi:MAG: hypothetical protein ACFCVH_21070 [Alphaproteobacteria bacterium]